MLALANTITSLPIIGMHDGQEIARISEIIFDGSTLTLAALMCTTRKNRSVLLARDIRYIARDCILINDESDLIDPHDLARFNQMIERHYNPFGKSVTTESGRKIGRVENYDLNLDNGNVQRIHVKQGIHQSWRGSSIIIDRSQIIKLEPTTIIVSDSYAEIPADESTVAAPTGHQSPASA